MKQFIPTVQGMFSMSLPETRRNLFHAIKAGGGLLRSLGSLLRSKVLKDTTRRRNGYSPWLYAALLAVAALGIYHWAQPSQDGFSAYEKQVANDGGDGHFPHELVRDFPAAQPVDDREAMLEEALMCVDLLLAYEDGTISEAEKAQKYRSLALAATLVSATLDDLTSQRAWSEMAVWFCSTAREALARTAAKHGEDMDEIKTRQLLAMAMNHYQGGPVTSDELAQQFNAIDKNFLIRKGFCKYKVMKALDRDGIIHLPAFSERKYI